MERWFWKIFILYLLVNLNGLDCHRLESNWAKKLGNELWHLSQTVTKYSAIKSKYRTLNASVVRNDGRSLLDQIIENISKMIQSKVTAVKCIVAAAEKASESYQVDVRNPELEYYNMKFSPANGVNYNATIPWKLDNYTNYKSMTLMSNKNFYNIPVNIGYSGVHIPTNLYDGYPHVEESINWSEHLDEIFVRNYQVDQSLGWQYFGTSSGMMRQFPAMHWKTEEEDVDLYDCRTRPWFIEAATCTKDIVILMDNSGSMTGMRNTIAKLVVKSLLDTFGNNDYINVLKFSWTAESVLPCYSDVLVQGTKKNIEMFREAVTTIKPEGNASFPNALTTAFKILEKFKNEDGSESNPHQAIMLVTDGLPGNITEVFEKYNINAGIRVFTYLVGTEVKGVQELQQMACQNRGYYVHIHNLDEVRDQVLKYISVIARPMALQGEQHPVIWTHPFADINDPKLTSWLWKVMQKEEQKRRLLRFTNIRPEYFSQEREDAKYIRKDTQVLGEEKQIEYEEYRLMTSISMPAFDNKSGPPQLLGIAGTDVPISQFYSLTYPYKIGANGYAFIITNNGYLVLHPDLRPVYDGILKMNYDSVDLAEVEFADDDGSYKYFNSKILELRNGMVNGEEGEILEMDVKFLYDDMKRVWTDKRDYYFSPLPGTSFSIGLAIPSNYGNYQIGVGDVMKKNFHQGIPLYKFLKEKDGKDKKWRIHPEWVYCKYFNASYKHFETAEDELFHFLEKMSWEGKKSRMQYQNVSEEFDYYENCTSNGHSFQEDAYYCDDDLLQLFLFDAHVTEPFKNPKLHKNEYEEKLLKTYKATLRFVSTQSGLTRWQSIPKVEDDEIFDFGNAFPRAIDEPWYKAAVLQHEIDRESFVFSVTSTSDASGDSIITATHAIFPVDGGKEAPASVVGFQFNQKSLYNRFLEIIKPKAEEVSSYNYSQICYILDHNGFIIISTSEKNETGLFFGEVEGEVMLNLIEKDFFMKIEIYDYQGLCIEEMAVSSDASFIFKPFLYLCQLTDILTTDLIRNVLRVFVQQVYNFGITFANAIYDSEEFEEDYEAIQNETIYIERNAWPCNKNITLYLLNHTANPLYLSGNSRLRTAEKIPHTNMVLLVLNDLIEKNEDLVISAKPIVLPMENCHTPNLKDFVKKRLSNCFIYHPMEDEIDACGRGNISTINFTIVLISYCIIYSFNRYS